MKKLVEKLIEKYQNEYERELKEFGSSSENLIKIETLKVLLNAKDMHDLYCTERYLKIRSKTYKDSLVALSVVEELIQLYLTDFER